MSHVGPKSDDKCPYKRESMLGQRRERQCDHTVRGRSDAAAAKEHLEPQEDRTGKEGFSLKDWTGHGLQNCARIHFCWFKPPSLW